MDSSPTWGVPGSTFLAMFAAAALILTVFALAVRERARTRVPEVAGPDGYARAHSRWRKEGETNVVAASLVFLRSRGLVEAGHDGTLWSVGGGADLSDPLDRAVLRAAEEGQRFRELKDDPRVRTELTRLRKEYRTWEAGVRRTYFAVLRRSRGALLPLVLLLAAGAARLGTDVVAGEPSGLLAALLAALAVLVLVLARRWVPLTPPRIWSERLQERTAYFLPADLAETEPDLAAVIDAEVRREAAERAETEAWLRSGRSGSLGGGGSVSGFSYKQGDGWGSEGDGGGGGGCGGGGGGGE